ncbi:MAG: alkaline phosphatase D family protein [Microthrixaceae bacterium]|nr:alkaline phosphatase D family protein [Microthrixaceae bacterium]
MPSTTSARSAATGDPYVPDLAFPDGIASGDPALDRVVLWTRVEPDLDRRDGVPVGLEVARDPEFTPSSLVTWATARAVADDDHTVALDVDGLEPGTTYFYRFTARGHQSPVGRTRTLPDGEVERVRIAQFSCQRYVHGYFPSHRDLADLALDAETDLDLVLSLGDYVYNTEWADDWAVPGRDLPARPEAVTLDEFRRRYHDIRADLALQAMHANFPVAAVFDNHDGMSDPDDPMGAGAVPAFFEQLPVRRFAGGDRIHRALSLGSMADVVLLDERQHRDREVPTDDTFADGADHPEIYDPERTMLGAEQREWLLGELAGSRATWRVIGSQLMVAPWRTSQGGPPSGRITHPGTYLNFTQWDGFQAERDLILRALDERGDRNAVVLSGDSHLFSVSGVALDFDDPDADPVLVELNGSSVTSANADERNLPQSSLTAPAFAAANPQLLLFDSERHGVSVVELRRDGAEAELRSPTTIEDPDAPVEVLARYRIEPGTARAEPIGGAGA